MYDANGVSRTFSTAGWYEYVLDIPFTYNGTDNLVVAVDNNEGRYYSGSAEFEAKKFL